MESSLGSWEPSETSSLSNAVQCIFAEGPAPVMLQSAPRKLVERMRDKILKYAADGSHAADNWPAAARILDPVRASIVCEGASQMLQVVQRSFSCG